MLGRITQITHEQLRLLLCGGWTRRIKSIHIHHTWRPDHAQWRGESTVVAMRRYHVEELGWSDIAQHLTIGPDGSLWTGRSLDTPPASAVGHNGSATEGPLMIEMVGDFDAGRDAFADPQAASVYQTVAEICAAFALDSAAVRFHNEFTHAKTCPGTALSLASFRPAVDQKLKAAAKRGAAAPNAHARAYAAGRRATSAAPERALEANAEPPYDATQAAAAADAAVASARGLFTSFGPEDIEVFRSHVVDLAHGQLSSGGCYQNSEADLDELIRRLDQWVAQRAAKPARIMFFAHGGLVSEAAGLGIVKRDYEWWLANDVYPIFFVWETGFLEIFTQQREIDLGARAFITDPLLEATLGPTVGEPAWSRMKDSAFLSSADTTSTGKPGGAALFAAKLAQWFASAHPQAAKVAFHAVGHSAGSIFHCHFLPAFEAKLNSAPNPPQPAISTLAFLAPAVRVDRFKELLLPRIGASIGRTSLFTMRRASELVDSVAAVYRKSLLYFVRNACEVPTHSTPILGLEESIRADGDLVRLFGLDGRAGKAQVIWSPTSTSEGDAASKSEKHGFFDNDWVTMNSVMRRILGIADSVSLPCPHLPEDDEDEVSPSTSPERGFAVGAGGSARSGGSGTAGRRTALCIGIDDYGAQSLHGCVADSNAWATALGAWGFTVRKLANGAATRAAIMAAMTATLDGCRAGDTAVIQFAGHGTQLPDGNGDETDGRDEAWVPHDFEQGEFVIDDDIGSLFDRYRERGLQLIVFTDCCHSGTSTRLLYRAGAPELEAHSRYMEVPPAIVRRFTQKRAAGQSGSRFGTQDSTGWEIHYAACQDRQSAYEHGGHGDFTEAATKALATALRTATTYQGFANAIAKAFAGNAQQMPQLRAQPGIGARALFGGARDSAGAAAAASAAALPSTVPGRKDDTDLAALAAAIEGLRGEVRALSKQIADL